MNAIRTACLVGLTLLGGLVAGCASGRPQYGSGSDDRADGAHYERPAARPLRDPAPSPARPPAAMQHQDYGVNPREYAADDRRSTFAIDVDTASYALAKRYIRGGQLPPPAAVRTEEFVNAFDYHYGSPVEGEMAIALDACRAPMREATLLLRVGLQARRVHPADRKRGNYVLVIDTSGSMAERGKLQWVQRACAVLLDNLHEDDRVAVVRYDSAARTVMGFSRAGERRAILHAIGQLRPGGNTSVQAGLLAGYVLADEAYDRRRINRVILFSDGVANTDRTGADDILALARRRRDEGITLTTIGVGLDNYNDTLLEQLADRGDGNYHYLNDLDAAERVLGETFTGNMQRVAEDVKVQVEFNDEAVRRYRLMGYENRAVADKDFHNGRVDGGDLGAGQSVTALYAVDLRAPLPDGPARPRAPRLATVRVRYRKPGSVWTKEISQSLCVDEVTAEPARNDLRLAATAAYFAEALRGSYWSSQYDLAAVADLGRSTWVEPARRDQLDELLELIAAARLADRPRCDQDERGWWEQQ